MEEERESHLNDEEQQEKQAVEKDQQQQLLVAEDKLILQYMDSMHNYLSLSDSLSCTLRQGWLELASARYSMGTSRVNSSLLDLKFHPASTTLKITKSKGSQPRFMLRKWVSSEHESTQLEDVNDQPQVNSDNVEVQKEQSKSLSVFGVLISPKLRATQLSFEKDVLVLVVMYFLLSFITRLVLQELLLFVDQLGSSLPFRNFRSLAGLLNQSRFYVNGFVETFRRLSSSSSLDSNTDFWVVQDAARPDGYPRCSTFGGCWKRAVAGPAILPRYESSKDKYRHPEEHSLAADGRELKHKRK